MSGKSNWAPLMTCGVPSVRPGGQPERPSGPTSGREDPEFTRLRDRVMGALRWSGITLVVTQASRFFFGIVLVRLLTPEEFGLASMALVASTLVLLLSDLTLGAGLVQRSRISEADRSTVFWSSAAIGAALSLLGIALSGVIADFFGEAEVQPLFAVLSLSFVVLALGRTHAALLHREMRFRAISGRVMASNVIGGCVGVILAFLGSGAWAVIGMHMTVTVASTVFLWTFASWYPRLTFSTASMRDLVPFASRLLGSNIARYVSGIVDKIVVGRLLGAAPLGVYAVGYNLVLVPMNAVVVAVGDTLFPALSRLQDDGARLWRAWLRATRLLAAAVLPTTLGLAVVAPELVELLLGDRWAQAVPVVQILALAGIFQSLSALGATVLIALDRTTALLRFSIVDLAFIVAGVLVGTQWGFEGVAAGYLVATVMTRVALAWMATRALDARFGSFLSNLRAPVEAAVLMTLGVALAREALVRSDVASPVMVTVLIVLGFAIYVPLLFWRAPDVLSELRALLSRRSSLRA